MSKIISQSTYRLFAGYLLELLLLFLFVNHAAGQSQSDLMLRKKQQEFAGWKYGIFLHFNMGTYVNKEWATGYEDPLLFNPANLDCGQWASVAKTAGMKYGVLTVKHTGGWCLWDSKYTTHDIAAFKNYKGRPWRHRQGVCQRFQEEGAQGGLVLLFAW